MKAIGFIIAALGIALSLWLGIVVFFIDGITDIINEAQEDQIEGGVIAWGLLRVLLASAVTFLGIGFSVILGRVIADD